MNIVIGRFGSLRMASPFGSHLRTGCSLVLRGEELDGNSAEACLVVWIQYEADFQTVQPSYPQCRCHGTT